MADAMQVEVVSPERKVASMEANAVMLPGLDGDFTAMAGHVPVATALRPGLVRVQVDGRNEDFLITGGFAEVSNAGVSVLAEHVATRDEATKDMFAGSLKAAEETLENADADSTAEAKRALDGLKSLVDGLN